MKKLIFLLFMMPLIMVSCYEGPWGARQEYTVSGNVYYPDSTPLAHASILVADTQYYSHALSGVSISDRDFSGRADENGHFEVTVPNGGKTGIWVMAYYQPTCDTAEVTYHYHGSITKHYSDKHGFEGLQIYTYVMEHPRHYPYLEPSYPFIGDSVRVVSEYYPINHIEIYEVVNHSSRQVVSSMDYQQPDTSVMFFVPEELSVEKNYYIDVIWENGGAHKKLHLREHEQ